MLKSFVFLFGSFNAAKYNNNKELSPDSTARLPIIQALSKYDLALKVPLFGEGKGGEGVGLHYKN